MSSRASIKDVAAAAGVSYKTVSRVVNGVTTVDEAIRTRVESAIQELHYVPNTAARSLKTGAPNTVGILVDSIDDVFFAAVISAIEDRAIAHDLAVVIGSTGHNAEREKDQLLRLAGQNVLGVIMAPAAPRLDYFEPYRTTTPLVAIDRELPGYDSVTVDDYHAASVLVELLVRVGHVRIGLLGWDPAFSTATRRREAYAAVLSRHGIKSDPSLAPVLPFDARGAAAAVEAMLALDEPPTALFLSNARHAASVVSTLHAIGRTDIAVVSFGDFLLADAVRPAITCMDQDPYEIGAFAFDRLLALAAQPSGAEPTLQQLPTRFVERQSHLAAFPTSSFAASA